MHRHQPAQAGLVNGEREFIPISLRLLIIAFYLLGIGCGHKQTQTQSTPSSVTIESGQGTATILDPQKTAAAPLLTRYPIRFTDISQAAGLRWKFTNGATGRFLFPESMGGGVTFLDFNHDGLLDIFAVQGGPVPGAVGKERDFPTRNALYRNNGDGTFTDVTLGSGLDAYTGYGQGVSVADYDNDGWPDIYITAIGGNHLFHNNRNSTFTDVTARAKVGDQTDQWGEAPWPLSAAWADYDNDGRLDLFVCHYCRWTLATNKACQNPSNQLSYCRPQVYEPSVCRLYHNNGDGTFTDVTHRAGLDKLQGKSMAAAWFDYDDDGWMDLFITNDTMVNFLLHNQHDGTFKEEAILAGVAYGEQDAAASGMGVGVGDYDNDGREDLFVVNYSGQPKSVFHNKGNRLFQTASSQAGIANTNLEYLGFGIECADYDLDGYKDLIVGNGHVLDAKDALSNGSTYEQSQQLFHNQRNGAFAEDWRSLGDLVKPRVTRGLAVGDVDNDGDLDLLMVSQTGPLQLFRNEGGNHNHWLTLRLEGITCNRDAIGAKITLRTSEGTQTQWVRGGSSYCSSSDLRVTFGLGQQTEVQSAEVRWPGGKTQKVGMLSANGFYWWRQDKRPVPDPRLKRKTRISRK